MLIKHPLAGIYAASLTPLKNDFTLDLEPVPSYLSFLANRGCHGTLLLGTTGEGPSFSPREREDLFKVAVAVRQEHPDFRLLAGTGTPSLQETILSYKLGEDFEESNGIVFLTQPHNVS